MVSPSLSNCSHVRLFFWVGDSQNVQQSRACVTHTHQCTSWSNKLVSHHHLAFCFSKKKKKKTRKRREKERQKIIQKRRKGGTNYRKKEKKEKKLEKKQKKIKKRRRKTPEEEEFFLRVFFVLPTFWFSFWKRLSLCWWCVFGKLEGWNVLILVEYVWKVRR